MDLQRHIEEALTKVAPDKKLVTLTNSFNREMRKELPYIIEDAKGDIVQINCNIAIRYLTMVVHKYLKMNPNETEWANESKKPKNLFQLRMEINDDFHIWATFVYVDDKHKVVLERCHIELLDSDYETVRILVER